MTQPAGARGLRRRLRGGLAAALLALGAGCAPAEEAAAPGCQVVERSLPLPPELDEASGVAIGRRAAGVLWAHNDSGDDPVVYAVGAAGEPLGAVRVPGAEHRDWEDLAVGPCPAGSCLYVGDIGDNAGRRAEVHLYRFPEPEPGAPAGGGRAERFRMRYPGGPRDAEALFVLPSGEVFVISKGGRGPAELFRYPLPLRAGEGVELERVASLAPAAAPGEVLQVTGADASPDGGWVAVRAYRTLLLYRAGPLLAGDVEPALRVDLTPVGEAQGEAVALADDGTVVLASEGARGLPGTMAVLRCDLGDPR